MEQNDKPSSKAAKKAGYWGCAPSLVLAISATSASVNYNLFATFLSLGFGIVGVFGLSNALVIAKNEKNGGIK
jgi:hypothetical protein